MKKAVSVFLLLFLAAALVSCGDSAPLERKLTHSYNLIVYNDLVFLYDYKLNTYCYHDINNVQPRARRLIGDALEDGTDDPLKQGAPPYLMVISEYETEKNGGYPVLYLCLEDYEIKNGKMFITNPRATKLVSFNTKTKAVKSIIVAEERIMGIYSYGEYIIFDTSDGDKGYNLHIVKCDGSGYKTLDNPDNLVFRAAGANGDDVYFLSGPVLYKTSFDLGDPTPILWDYYGFRFFYNDCFYYMERGTDRLLRYPLDGTGGTSVVTEYGVTEVKTAGNKIVFKKKNELIADGAAQYIFYILDLDTLEEKRLFELDNVNYTLWSIDSFDGKSILFQTYDLNNKRELCVINVETGEKTFMSSGW